ncbi:uracil phosphoribosyltransferase [Pycnococcus provasolii]
MVATGGTAINAVRDVLDRGADVKNVRLVCAVCAPPALTKLGEEFPELIMYSAIDD